MEQLEGRALLATLFVDGSYAGPELGTQAQPFRHIQAAIDAATTPGDEVDVAAGVYAESLTISHSIKLLGPNAGINPNSGARQPEAIILPAANNPVAGRMILVTGNNVTIDGLTIDGHNASLPTGIMLNNISVNAATGIGNVSSAGGSPPVIDGLRVQNNIIQNLTSFGVLADINDFSKTPLAISTNNVISNNRLDNMPDNDLSSFGGMSFNPGRGISVEHNFYADVTGNVVTRAGTAIQVIFMLDDPHHAAYSVSNNEVHAYSMGIYLWTIDPEVPAFNVANNTVFAENDPKTLPDNSGIRLNRVLHTTGVTLTNNNVQGTHSGLLLQYTSENPALNVAGGTLDGNDYGVVLTNLDPPGGNAPVQASLSGVTIKNSHTAALRVADAIAANGPMVTLTVDAATTLLNNARGAEISGADAKLVESVKPVVTLTGTPPATTSDATASFSFTTTDNVSTTGDLVIRYKLDSNGLVAATSPINLSGLSIGTHTLVVQATDQAGNTGSASYTWQVTTVPPPAPPTTPVLDPASDSGAADGTTNDNTPTFNGTAPAGNSVSLFAGSTLLGTTTADSSGQWSFTVGGPGSVVLSLASGSYAITATDMDSGDRVSQPSGTLAIVIDTVLPSVSITSGPASTTTDTSATFTFTATDNVSSGSALVLEYSLDGGPLTPAASPIGLMGLSISTHTFVVQATDAAGNTGSASYNWEVTNVSPPPPPAPPSTPLLDPASDSGAADGITKDDTPTFNGTAPAGNSVSVFAGPTLLGTTTADSSGNWSFTVGGAGAVIPSLGSGSYAITATDQDSSGGVSQPSGALTIVIDTVLPSVSITSGPALQTTDTSATFRFTASDNVSSGSALVVKFSLDGGPFLLGASPLGLTDLSVGTHTLVVQATDAAGNTGSASYAWEVTNATPPPPPAPPSTPVLDPASDTGAADGITKDDTPTFNGTAPAGNTVSLFAGSTLLGTTTANSSGNWSFTVGGAGSSVPSLASGSYAITAADMDSGGRVSQPSGALAILIDTVLPTVSFTSGPASQTTDTSATFRFTTTDNVSSGSALVVRISLDGGPFMQGASPVGLTDLSVGTHTFAVQATDAAGNTGSASYQWTVNAVTSPPPPSTPMLDASSDTGTSSTDGITNDNTPTLSGNAQVGTTVTLFAGSMMLGTAPVDSSGRWSFTVGGAGSVVASLNDGRYAIAATAANGGGTSGPSVAQSVLIDTILPTILTSRSPQPNAAGWNRGNVSASYAASDGGSGLASPAVGSFTFTNQGAGQSRVFTVKDVAGNTASATVGPVNIDKGKPAVTIAASPNVLQPPDGRQVKVTVSGKVTDGLSGFAGSVTYTVRDSYGQVASSGTANVGAGGSYSFALSLPASLNSRGTARTFTITVTGTDVAGKTKAVSTTVRVPAGGSGSLSATRLTPYQALLLRLLALRKWRR